jgi:hypothetical protein
MGGCHKSKDEIAYPFKMIGVFHQKMDWLSFRIVWEIRNAQPGLPMKIAFISTLLYRRESIKQFEV